MIHEDKNRMVLMENGETQPIIHSSPIIGSMALNLIIKGS